jgi:hypothetical protein
MVTEFAKEDKNTEIGIPESGDFQVMMTIVRIVLTSELFL